MADKPIQTPLPADLPDNWTIGQIVAPAGSDVGLSQQHGYNYLMEQVNAAQQAVNTVNDAFSDLATQDDLQAVEDDKGVPNGLATLGADGKLSDGQVPSAEKIGYTNPSQPSAANVKQALDALQEGLENGTITPVEVTAAASGWDGTPAAQTLTVNGMTGDSLYWVGLDSTATLAQRDAARKAVIAPTAQGENSLTLTVDGVTPAVDLPILVFLSGGAS